MSLENLFIEGPQFSETSMIKLPQSPGQWNEVIISLVKEKYPMVESLPMVVQFKEMSEDTGTAVGAVTITHPTLKKSCFIPLIIKGGMMFPMDVWQDEKQAVRPITEDTFEVYFFNEKTFDALEKKSPDPMGQYFSDPSLWQSTYPPLQGRYAYASAGGAMLGMMLEDASVEDAKTFTQTLEENPGALLLYRKHGTLDLVKKAAKKMEEIPISSTKSKVQTMPVDKTSDKPSLVALMAVVRKEPKKWTVLSAHQGQFVTKSSYGTQDEMNYAASRIAHLTTHGEDHLNDIPHIGEKSFKMPEGGATGVFIQDTLGPAPDKVSKFGAYRVKRVSDGAIMKGLVIPTVIDLDQKVLGQKIFLGGSNASMQTSIAGYPVETSADARSMLKDLSSAPMQVGQTGVFILVKDDSAISTEPIQLIRMDGDACWRAANFAGKVFKMRKHMSNSVDHGLQRIAKFECPEYTEYTIPSPMIWVPINTFKPVSASGAEFMEKIAHEQKRDTDPLKVTFTGLGFQVLGRNFEKVANTFDPYNMQEYEVKFVSRVLGASKDMADEIIKVAKSRGRAVVHGLKEMQSPEPLYKQASATKKAVEKFCNSIKSNLVKEAAGVNDKQTVDAILSLNFVNPENIRKLVEAMPILIKAHFKLAELVLASRLGAEEIPHEPTVVCMHRMTEVLKGVKLLDHSFSQVATQSKEISKAKKGDTRQNLVQAGGIS